MMKFFWSFSKKRGDNQTVDGAWFDIGKNGAVMKIP